MTTIKLIMLRFYNLIFGRFEFGRKFLRNILELFLIANKSGDDRYVPCSKYFNYNYFKKDGR